MFIAATGVHPTECYARQHFPPPPSSKTLKEGISISKVTKMTEALCHPSGYNLPLCCSMKDVDLKAFTQFQHTMFAHTVVGGLEQLNIKWQITSHQVQHSWNIARTPLRNY